MYKYKLYRKKIFDQIQLVTINEVLKNSCSVIQHDAFVVT